MIEPISRSWRQQQLLAATAFIAVALPLIALHWFASRADLAESVRVQAALIGDSASAALVFDDPLSANDVAAAGKNYPQVLEVAIYRADGTLLAFHSAAGGRPAQRIAPPARVAHHFSLEHLAVETPVRVDGKPVGGVRLRVGLSGFYLGQAQFAGGLAIIILLTAAVYFYTSAYLRKRVASAEDALHHLALHDRLTGLSNRHAFEIMLEQAFRRHRRDGGQSILFFLDVDGFKRVNDLFGHHVGDQALQSIGLKIRSVIRGSDIVARMGGDEFGAILLDTEHPDDAARIAEHLIELMAKPFAVDHHQVHLGLSIGIALIPDDGASVLDLQKHADMAMYQAKHEGKNTYRFFSKNIGDEVRARHEIELQLRAALTEDQLFVDYQPQVDDTDGTIRGAEALLRWRHPERGLIAPTTFIPIAEESDLILEIGDWVLRRVLRDIQAADRRGLRLPPVAINVSARQFARRNMAQIIGAQLAACGLTPDRIEIELTESVLMEHSDRALTTFDAIRASGLRFAVDDFGTGYSSLAYLKRLPVSKLKIDRAFIANLAQNEEDRVIVRAIIQLAGALGLNVVAECVETRQQAATLHTLGCPVFQGYLTGRPASLEHLISLLPEKTA